MPVVYMNNYVSCSKYWFFVLKCTSALAVLFRSPSSACHPGSSGEGEVVVEDILGLVVWVILGTQHLETTLELINVESKILHGMRML